ncbi:MAG: hypothetical protein N3B21_11550 [Clostridia bacterium]|nr:hypothetical protein [Clostridia bacterium]
MRYFVFLKKEIMEILKTSKIYILPAVFLFIGLVSPLFAKFSPQLVEMMMKSSGQNIDIKIPDPTYIDAFMQIFKNLNPMGVIVIILTFVGSVVEEKIKGSAVLVLTKSVSRTQFILSKFLSSVILISASFILLTAAFLLYTYILFPGFSIGNLWVLLVIQWLYCIVVAAITILASTLGKSFTVSAVLAFLGFMLMSATSYIPYVKKFSPGEAGTLSVEILRGTKKINELAAPGMTMIVFCLAILLAAVSIFRKQEL